jgi:gamma-glutamyltranspeptidase/glutathione hydrolase
MLRRVSSFGTGCLLLEGSVSRYMKQFPNVKETYTSDGKIPGKAIYSGIHFSRNVQKKIAKGDEMNL